MNISTGRSFPSCSSFLLFIIFFFFTLTTLLLQNTFVQCSDQMTRPLSGNGSGGGIGSYCKIPCEKDRFDLGRDCIEAPGTKCQCVAHCCWAFDCRRWPVFANCRKKCRVLEWSRFGPNKGPAHCDHFRCPDHHLLPWDLRNIDSAEETEVLNCVQHCCYAFNCKRYSGYCRDQCMHVEYPDD